MSCLKLSVSRVDDISASATRVDSIDASAQRIGGIRASATRVDSFNATATKKSGITVRMYQACRPNITKAYLEIEPEIVWVLAGYAQNDVFSNTNWNIQ